MSEPGTCTDSAVIRRIVGDYLEAEGFYTQAANVDALVDERDTLVPALQALDAELTRVKEAVEIALQTFVDTPPTTEFQRGYLACLVNACCIGGYPETEALRACRPMLNSKQKV